MDLLSAEGDLNERLAYMNNVANALMGRMDGDNARALAEINVASNAVLQTSMSAANVASEHMQNISSILSNPDIILENKAGLVKQANKVYAATLAVIGGVSDMDLLSLLDFSEATPDSTTGTERAGLTDQQLVDMGLSEEDTRTPEEKKADEKKRQEAMAEDQGGK
jgi:hypothetical protein